MSDSTPNFPFIEEIEVSILAVSLQNRKFWTTFYPHIKSGYFKNKHLSYIFKILRNYYNKHKEMPTQEQMRNFNFTKELEIEEELIKLVYTKQIEKHVYDNLHEEVSDFIKKEKIRSALMKGAHHLEQKQYDLIESVIRTAVNWDSKIDLGIEISNVEENLKGLEDLITGVIPSPWKRLNPLIGGGFYNKELTAFTSGSSVGKSIALDQCAFGAWSNQSKNVVSITLEMSQLRKAMRTYASSNGIPLKEVPARKKEIISFFENKETDKKLYIKEFPTSSISTSDIEHYFHNLQLYENLEKPDLLVVDYGDILLPKGNVSKTPYLDQGQIFENLRAIAQIYEIPVITATQLQRSSVELSVEELNESNLADSWKKMQIVDTLIALVSTSEDRRNGRMHMKLLKNRNGEKDLSMPFFVNYQELRISDFKSTDGEN